METTTLSGKLVSGLGEAGAFTRIDWARRQFMAKLGIDPYPGTLNLVIEAVDELARWRVVTASPGVILVSPRDDWCNARCYPARIADGIADPINAAIVLPEIADYPKAKLELIAAVGVRDRLGLRDGDPVTLEIDI